MNDKETLAKSESDAETDTARRASFMRNAAAMAHYLNGTPARKKPTVRKLDNLGPDATE